jgi:hypothetical protein
MAYFLSAATYHLTLFLLTSEAETVKYYKGFWAHNTLRILRTVDESHSIAAAYPNSGVELQGSSMSSMIRSGGSRSDSLSSNNGAAKVN